VIRLAIVDDHPAIVAAIEAAIEDRDDLVLVGATTAAVDAVELVDRTAPDVVVCDLWLDGEPARSRERLDAAHAVSTAERAKRLAGATLRELVPGQSAAEEASLAAERTRLAGDLHAVVMPSLRRAMAEAESGGDPDTLARHLRTVDRELERLMADRWPVVLEAFGLVAALEDLAEQIESDAGPAVEIDVERAGGRPAPAIERAAWRVAEIAVDNAVRHAAATTIRVTVAVDADRLRLVIADDGRGFDPTRSGAIRAGARGLADANRRASEVGASVLVEGRSGGGTTVAFAWTERRP